MALSRIGFKLIPCMISFPNHRRDALISYTESDQIARGALKWLKGEKLKKFWLKFTFGFR